MMCYYLNVHFQGQRVNLVVACVCMHYNWCLTRRLNGNIPSLLHRPVLAGLSPRGSRFNVRPVLVGFVVYELALRQVFLWVLHSPLSLFQHAQYSLTTDAIKSHPASCTMGTGSFLGVKSGRGVKLTPHPLLVPWSWKGRAIPLLPYSPYGLYRASVPVRGWPLPSPLPIKS